MTSRLARKMGISVLFVISTAVIGFGIPLLWLLIAAEIQGAAGITRMTKETAVAVFPGIVISYVIGRLSDPPVEVLAIQEGVILAAVGPESYFALRDRASLTGNDIVHPQAITVAHLPPQRACTTSRARPRRDEAVAID